MNTYSFWQLVAAAVLLFGVVLPLAVAAGMIWLGMRRARVQRSGDGKASSKHHEVMASSTTIVRERL